MREAAGLHGLEVVDLGLVAALVLRVSVCKRWRSSGARSVYSRREPRWTEVLRSSRSLQWYQIGEGATPLFGEGSLRKAIHEMNLLRITITSATTKDWAT